MVNGMSKNEAWDYAVGMIKGDDIEPTPEMKRLIEMEKRGEVTKEEIHDSLCRHYRMKKG